jgi:uncharacterized RDD family membrane protein YckC
MRQVFNTSVGTLEVSLDRLDRTISIYRFDDKREAVAGAIEAWDHVDLLDVLNRHIGLPLAEANRIAAELREQMSVESLAERVEWGRRERARRTSVQKAGVPLRFVAVFLDFVLVLVPLGLIVGLMSGGGYTESGPGYSNAGIEVSGNAFWLLLVLAVGYYVVCEAATGMTLGKWMVGIEVVGEDGATVTFGAAVVRNVLRLVDALLFYLVAFFFVLTSPRGQRLGDRAAHTVVICR